MKEEGRKEGGRGEGRKGERKGGMGGEEIEERAVK